MKTVLRNRTAAFTLVEMVIVISMLLFFGMISVRVITLSLRIPREAAQSQSTFERFDIALSRLRQDVWAARSLRCPDEMTLEIGADGPSTVWHVESDGALTRTVSEAGQPPTVRRWESGQTMRFEVDGPMLNFTVTQNSEPARAVMISQRLIGEGSK